MAQEAKPKLAPSYRDLIKTGLINDNFLSKQTFSVKTEAKAGDATVKTSVICGEKAPVGTFEPKYEMKAEGIVFEGKVSTAHNFNGKVTAKDFFLPGLNVSFTGDRSTTQDKDSKLSTNNTGTIGVQYNNELTHVAFDCKVPLAEDLATKTNLSLAVSAKPSEQLAGGVSLGYTFDGKYTAELKVAGGNDEVEVGLSGSYPKKAVNVNVTHKANTQLTWGVDVAVPINDEGADDVKNPSVNLAGEYKFDDFSTLKGKFTTNVDPSSEHEFRAALGLQQKINDNTTVTLGADFNLNSALCLDWQPGAATSCGFQISFK